MNGDVSVRRGDSGDVVAAALNAPLMGQDGIATGQGSRMEIQFDNADVWRVGSFADVRLGELDYGRYLLQVARGTTTFRVLREPAADVEIGTPSVSVRTLRAGSYRVTVLDDGSTEISVRFGEAEIYSPRGSERLPAGRTMIVRGTPQEPLFQVYGLAPYDAWDQFCDARDQELLTVRSAQYMGQDIGGGEELDRNGRWLPDAEYGTVWTPTVGVGSDWAPYRNGRWVWLDCYGWSWVSADPWGWAPYHYGRWFFRPAVGWCWTPMYGGGGRHYWSPALVGFFGFGGGGGVGVSFGFGNVGWLPLGPRDRFYPWWGPGFYHGYRGGTGLASVANVSLLSEYHNARYGNAVSFVNANGFGRGGRVEGWRGGSLSGVGAFRGAVPVAPGRESLSFRNAAPGRGGSFTPMRSQQFVSRRAPATIDRVPFEQQQHGVQQMAQRTLANAGRSASPAVSVSGLGTSPVSPVGGYRRADRPASSASGPVPQVAAGQEYRRYGSGSASPAVQGYSPPVHTSHSAAPAGQQSQTLGGWQRFGVPMGSVRGPSSGGGAPASPSYSSVAGGRYAAPAPAQARPVQPPVPSGPSAPGYGSSRPSGGNWPSNGFAGSPQYNGGGAVRVGPSVVRQPVYQAPAMPRFEQAPRQQPQQPAFGRGSYGGGGGRSSGPPPSSSSGHQSAPSGGSHGGSSNGGSSHRGR